MDTVSEVTVVFVGPNDLGIKYHWAFPGLPSVGTWVNLNDEEYQVVKHHWKSPTYPAQKWQVTITLE
jgi:hypothetical protein